ncbi:MAG: peptidylprolyl isomerase [Desulfonatronovibrio sp.]
MQVLLSTNFGDITIDLEADKSPLTVENFLNYIEQGFYNDTIFHRVIPGFMIQGGGLSKDMTEKKTAPPIKNEAKNGLLNLRGTLAMARTQDKDSATSQFFINLSDNHFLDHGSRDFGYAVFARVSEGMEVVDKIAGVATGRSGFHEDVPKDPVIIKNAALI